MRFIFLFYYGRTPIFNKDTDTIRRNMKYRILIKGLFCSRRSTPLSKNYEIFSQIKDRIKAGENYGYECYRYRYCS